MTSCNFGCLNQGWIEHVPLRWETLTELTSGEKVGSLPAPWGLMTTETPRLITSSRLEMAIWTYEIFTSRLQAQTLETSTLTWPSLVLLFLTLSLSVAPLSRVFFSGVERAKRQEHLRGVGTSELVARQPVEHGSEPCDVSGYICNACPRTLLCETVILAKVLAAHFPSREPRGLWWIFVPSMEVFWTSIGHQTGYRFSVHTTPDWSRHTTTWQACCTSIWHIAQRLWTLEDKERTREVMHKSELRASQQKQCWVAHGDNMRQLLYVIVMKHMKQCFGKLTLKSKVSAALERLSDAKSSSHEGSGALDMVTGKEGASAKSRLRGYEGFPWVSN